MLRSLHENCVETTKKSAQILTKDDGDKLWECGVLVPSKTKGLQNTVFTMLVNYAV